MLSASFLMFEDASYRYDNEKYNHPELNFGNWMHGLEEVFCEYSKVVVNYWPSLPTFSLPKSVCSTLHLRPIYSSDSFRIFRGKITIPVFLDTNQDKCKGKGCVWGGVSSHYNSPRTSGRSLGILPWKELLLMHVVRKNYL